MPDFTRVSQVVNSSVILRDTGTCQVLPNEKRQKFFISFFSFKDFLEFRVISSTTFMGLYATDLVECIL